jgi:hypothetical protein
MDGLADVGRIAAHFHRETDFTDQIASVGADDPPAGSGAMRDISVVMRPLCRPSAFLCECQLPFVLSTPATAPTTPAERELPLANAVGQLDAGDRDGGIGERFEPGHRRTASLDRAVVLLNEVVEILVCANCDVPPAGMGVSGAMEQKTALRNGVGGVSEGS